MEQGLAWEADSHSASQEIPLAFMEAEGSLPYSLVPSKHKPTDLCNSDAVCFLGGRNREK
jgi:hypothetical protein